MLAWRVPISVAVPCPPACAEKKSLPRRESFQHRSRPLIVADHYNRRPAIGSRRPHLPRQRAPVWKIHVVIQEGHREPSLSQDFWCLLALRHRKRFNPRRRQHLLDQLACGKFIVHNNRSFFHSRIWSPLGAASDIILTGTPVPIATSTGVDLDTS